ncbi:Colicin V production protein [Corynebacterium appendicis CIP 107643]|uniref:Colicin V production protein n=1 Tax=Corynebacterium appendicis CIP 107643 TaxID=1161099 RepID=A0A1N7INS9_9CORY|nr:MarP family serine protease [Corynebacterium appendicis]WJY60112.1 Serine protease [Corynebacterium appendicis CIP 107643]SIS38702.1 Colicin V production protein [Corynebacterium appendicis CIP 107643]
MTALIVDFALVVLFGAALAGGWRQGAFSSAFAALGVVAGLVVGLGAAGLLVRVPDVTSMRVLLLLATVVTFVGVGNIVGATVGAAVRDRLRSKSTQAWDSAVGSLLQLFMAVVVAWVVAVPVAANAGEPLGSAVRGSRILGAVDSAVPEWGNKGPEYIARLIDVTGLPPLVSPFQGGGAEVEAPDPDSIDPGLVEDVRPSVVHVLGDAESCSRHLSGSGFVSAPDYVVTNAHVVAGTESVELDTVLGLKRATVVLYDPEVDIAVLHVPNLGLEPLPTAPGAAKSGDDAMVLGFPAGGPFAVSPVRVRERLNISGPDIYAAGRTEREALTLRGSIRQGNSGGPLLSPTGEVLGVVFGTAVDGNETGYALTIRQMQQVVGEYEGLTEPVDTQACVA